MSQAQTGKMDIKSRSQGATAYQHSFGSLKSKTTYSDPWLEQDRRAELKGAMEEGMKALTTSSGGSGTAGQALIPVYVDPRIVDKSRKWTPLVEMIPRVTNQGLTADFNVIESKGSAVTAAEDAPLTESDDTENRESESIKYVYSVGRVTGPEKAAMPSYILEGMQPSGSGLGGDASFGEQEAPNAMQKEVLTKARAIKEKEEDLILNGDSSTDSTEYDGIVKQMGTTNQVDLSSDALTYDDIVKAVRLAYDDGGRPNLAVCSSAVLSDIRKIMIDTYRYGPQDNNGEIPFGSPAATILGTIVGDIPVIPSMFLSNTSGSKQIFFLDTDYIEMRVLQDMTYERLAKTNDSDKFMLKIYECLILRAPQFNSFIDNIA